jgi:hypothetical protein
MPRTTIRTAKISRYAVSPLEVGPSRPFDGGLTFPAEKTKNAKIETKAFRDRHETTGDAGSARPDVTESLNAARKRWLKKSWFRVNGRPSAQQARLAQW